jgi:hypothetical protein
MISSPNKCDPTRLEHQYSLAEFGTIHSGSCLHTFIFCYVAVTHLVYSGESLSIKITRVFLAVLSVIGLFSYVIYVVIVLPIRETTWIPVKTSRAPSSVRVYQNIVTPVWSVTVVGTTLLEMMLTDIVEYQLTSASENINDMNSALNVTQLWDENCTQ